MTNSLALTYPAVLNHIQKHMAEGRTESRAFLAWFLENYFRLEEIEAQDAVCDGPDDRGVDGIHVDDNLEQVNILQSKLLRSTNKTLGDTQLKEFYGTLTQFSTPDNITHIAATTSNLELRNLILDFALAEKVGEGYSVKGIYVTNISADPCATRYLVTCTDLELFDAQRLENSYVPPGPTDPLNAPVTLDLLSVTTMKWKPCMSD